MTNDTEFTYTNEPEERLNFFNDDKNDLGNKARERCAYYQEYIGQIFTMFSKENEETKSASYLDAYFTQYPKAEQCLERIVQAMVNELSVSECDTEQFLDKYRKMLSQFAAKSKITRNNILAEIAKVLEPLLSNHLPGNNLHAKFAFDWAKHRNTCIVLICMFDYVPEGSDVSLLTKANRAIRCQLSEYFLWIICECKQNSEAVYYALLGMQKIALQFGLKASTWKMLKDALEKCVLNSAVATAQTEQQHQTTMNDLFGHQTKLAIYWFVEHVMTRFDLKIFHNEPVRMSKDGLSVRCAHHQKHYNVHSKFRVSDSATNCGTHAYYYEVTLVTGGPMRIGWNCNVKRPGRAAKLGWDKFSIAYDGYNRQIWHLSGGEPVTHYLANKQEEVERWRPGDVVGCFIELCPNNDYFYFYLNGKQIKYKSKKYFTFHSKYRASFQASATLFTEQQCIFNFGPKFKHEPDEKFNHFHVMCNKNLTDYQLEYWSDSTTNHSAAVAKEAMQIKDYADDKQILFDNMIAKWLSNTAQKVSEQTFNETSLKEKQHKPVKQVLRMCQSVVNLVDDSVTVNLYEFDVNFYQVMMPIALDEKMLNELVLKMLNTFEYCIEQQKQQSQNQSVWPLRHFEYKLRSMCLMFVLVLYNTNWNDENLKKESSNVANTQTSPLGKLFHFLHQLVDNCENQEVIFYSLKCIEMLPLDKISIDNSSIEQFKETLEHLQQQQNLWYHDCECTKANSTHIEAQVREKLNEQRSTQLTNEASTEKIANSKFDLNDEFGNFYCSICYGRTMDNPMTTLECHVGFCAASCLAHLQEPNKNKNSYREYYNNRINSLQVSCENEINQSIASGLNRSFDSAMAHSNGYTSEAGVYYYEAHLLTSGPVIVGWTTLDMDLSPNKDIVGLDLYRKVVRLNSEIECDVSNVVNNSNSTKASIVGCKIEISSMRIVKCVAFYLNGREIYSKDYPSIIATQDAYYYPAIYMGQHQHGCMNLGQVDFNNTNLDKIEVIKFSHYDTDRYKLKMREIGEREKENEKFLPTNIPSSSLKQNTAPSSVLDQILTNQIVLSKLNDSDAIQLMCDIVKSTQSSSIINKVDVLVGLLVKNVTIQNYASIKDFIEHLMADTEACAFGHNISLVLWALQKIKSKCVYGKNNQVDTIEVNILPHVLKTLKKGDNSWSLLFALYCLIEIWKLKQLRSIIEKQKVVLAKIDQLAEEFEKTNLKEQLFNPILVQVGLCAQYFLRLTRHPEAMENPQRTEPLILKPFKMDADAHKSLVFSNDGFCVRNYDYLTNDYIYVRSTRSIGNSGVYYFETILLTSGAFQVGWSTLDKNETQFVLDLHTKSMRVNGDEASVVDFLNWNVGDIVGCMIDIVVEEEKKTTVNNYIFYLNGKRIRYPKELGEKRFSIKTSNTQLVPFIGLGIYQQCYANFGQHSFKNEEFNRNLSVQNSNIRMSSMLSIFEHIFAHMHIDNNKCIVCCKQTGVYRMSNCDHMICRECSYKQVQLCYICDKEALVPIETVDDVTDSAVATTVPTSSVVSDSDTEEDDDDDDGLSYLLEYKQKQTKGTNNL